MSPSPTPALAALGVTIPGSIEQQSVTLTGALSYWAGPYFVTGTFAGSFGESTINSSDRGGTGRSSFSAVGFALEAGRTFAFGNAVAPTAMPVKAQVRGARNDGMTGFIVDLSARLRTMSAQSDGYEDSAGFGPFGGSNLRATTLGVNARVTVPFISGRTVVASFVAAAYDHAIDRSHRLHLPSITPGVAPDTIIFDLGRDTFRAEAGVTTFWGQAVLSGSVVHVSSDDSRSFGGRGSVTFRF